MLLATASNIETKYGFYDFLLIIRYWICVLSRPFLAYRTAFSSILLLMSHVVVSLMLTSTCMSFKATANWIRMPLSLSILLLFRIRSSISRIFLSGKERNSFLPILRISTKICIAVSYEGLFYYKLVARPSCRRLLIANASG